MILNKILYHTFKYNVLAIKKVATDTIKKNKKIYNHPI